MRPGGYVSTIQFNNGESIDIKENDIVVFVGPNNAGKSRSLKDIYELCEHKKDSVVVSDICIRKYQDSVTDLLNRIGMRLNHGSYQQYSILDRQFTVGSYTDNEYLDNKVHGEFRNLFVANLDTEKRLLICKPPQTINRNASKTHPIHYAAFNREYREWLSKSFEKAFGIEVIPNTQFGATIPLCIGKSVKFDEDFSDEQERQETYAAILETYPQVQDQGDGIKSFTGILLNLMLDYYCTYLIDEPESFLHPPQARIMGQIIGETLTSKQQAFIATHSDEIIKGLLEVCPERLKIIRITRDGNTNHFSVLRNESFSAIWGDPLLKHSNMMTSLFHKNVVLCESDADCQMYSIIANHLKQKEGKYSETLFIHCGGKDRMSKVICALRSLDIDVKVVPDIDVMNNVDTFKKIVESFDIDWTIIQKDYRILDSQLHSAKETIKRTDAKETINRILDGSDNDIVSKEERERIRTAVKTTSKWETIKEMGIQAIPAGDATSAFNRLNQTLIENGFFLVPVGELECFIKDVGGHGPAWVNSVLEKHPDLDDTTYTGISQFIASMHL